MTLKVLYTIIMVYLPSTEYEILNDALRFENEQQCQNVADLLNKAQRDWDDYRCVKLVAEEPASQ